MKNDKEIHISICTYNVYLPILYINISLPIQVATNKILKRSNDQYHNYMTSKKTTTPNVIKE